MGWTWDPERRLLLVPSWWKWNQPESPAALKGYLKDLRDIPDCDLRTRASVCPDWFPDSFKKAWSETLDSLPGFSPEPPPINEGGSPQKPDRLPPPGGGGSTHGRARARGHAGPEPEPEHEPKPDSGALSNEHARNQTLEQGQAPAAGGLGRSRDDGNTEPEFPRALIDQLQAAHPEQDVDRIASKILARH